MNYLIDTCVLSELLKPTPNEYVIDWMNSLEEESMYISSLTVGEIQKGISKLSDSRKKHKLQIWLEDELIPRFGHRIIGIDLNISKKWGKIQAMAECRGFKMPVIDSFIACTGIVNRLTVATRNVRDMEISGVELYNPWEPEETR